MIAELSATRARSEGGAFELAVRFEPAPGTIEPSTWSYRVDDAADAVAELSVLPALPAAFVLACRLSQDLRVVEPLPPAVHRAAAEIGAVLAAWYGWRPVELIAPVAEDATRPRWARRRRSYGVFFTRGVDSWGTVLRLLEGPAAHRPTHLVAVDNEVHLPQVVRDHALADTKAAADDLGLPLVVVRTGVRAALDPHTDWGSDTHGSVFAGIGWLLRRSLDRIALSPTNSSDLLVPWGSHPELEPRWSLPDLQVEHLGDAEPRWVRVRRIAGDARVQRSLQVCWQGGSLRNCGRCEKCLRLRTDLELAGVGRCFDERFDVPWDPDRIDALEWSNAQARADLLDHCDHVGLVADPLRQRWEGIERRRVRGSAGAERPRQPRLVVAGSSDGRVEAGRHLARLGLRVDHRADRDASDALVLEQRGRATVARLRLGGVEARDAVALAELRTAHLLPLLDALGVDPDGLVPFPSHPRPPTPSSPPRR